MDNWDFDCPQFVDFAAALDNPTDDVFHDLCSDVQTTAACESSDLGPKMATPKIKPNDPQANFPLTNLTTDDEKLATLYKLPQRLSKSDGCLNRIIKSLKSPEEKENHRLCKTKRRTSFSVNYLKKRRVCPTTPNCLKRTIENSKLKNAKTSEELELQKIAELQNMLHKHLRLNKINLKRLKMNKAPFTLENLPKKIEPKAPAMKSNFTASSKPATTTSRKLPLQSNAVCGAAAFFRGVNNHLERLQTKDKPNVAEKKKPPSNVLRDHNVQKKDNDDNLKKQPLLEKYNKHGGLKFLPHQESTLPCPFSFDTSISSSNASFRATNQSKLHTSLSVSKSKPYLSENKENIVM